MKQKERYTNERIKNAWQFIYDHSLAEERLWWNWLCWVSIPLIILAFVMKLFGPANQLLSWPALIFLIVLLFVSRILLVWHFQRLRKKAKVRISELQHEIDAGKVWFEKKQIPSK